MIAVIALLITIAGALAAPTGSFDPNTNGVTVLKNASQDFKYTIANNDAAVNLTYTWSVDDQVKKTESSNQNYTSVFSFNGKDYATGSHTVGVTVIGSDLYLQKTWAVTVQDPQPASLLSVSKVKVNGKTNGKLSPSKVNKIEVEVSNYYDKKIEDITVTVKLLDVDDDDLEEEAEISKLSSKDEDTVEVEFDLSKEDLDEDEYTLEIEVEGEATDNTDHSDTEKLDLKVDREKDDLVITKADLEDGLVLCSAPQTSLDVQVRNAGENDQEGAKITVQNSALGMNLQRANLDLDDYSGSDNDQQATFALNLEDAKPGTYTLEVSVYDEDGDLMDTKEVELQVECTDGAASQEEKVTEYYADKELAAELQKKIDEYKALQESQQTAAKENFRESNLYVLLLGVLVAMSFFSVALSATYLLVKKKKKK